MSKRKKVKLEANRPSTLSNYSVISMLKENNHIQNPSLANDSDQEKSPHPLETYDLQKDLLSKLSTEMDSLEKKKRVITNFPGLRFACSKNI